MNRPANNAPPWRVSQWFNTPEPITLAGLRGRVVVLHTFQMLCPGCVAHGLPQAVRVHRLFPQERVTVIGLHTVFEHHDVMGPQALRVFLDEYGIAFPVGVDQADPASSVPLTMQAYRLQGTPSVLVFDHVGHLQLSQFGQIDDLQLGAVVGQLIARAPAQTDAKLPPDSDAGADHCADGTCGTGPES